LNVGAAAAGAACSAATFAPDQTTAAASNANVPTTTLFI